MIPSLYHSYLPSNSCSHFSILISFTLIVLSPPSLWIICVIIIFTTQMSCVLNLKNKKKQSWMFIEHTHSWIQSLHTIWLSNNSFGTPLSQHFTDVYHILNSREYAYWQSNVLAKLLDPSWRTNACLPLRHAVCSHFVVQVPGVFWQKGNWANRFSDIPDNPSDFHAIYSWWYFRHTIELSCEQMFSVIPSTTPSEFPHKTTKNHHSFTQFGVFPRVTTCPCF